MTRGWFVTDGNVLSKGTESSISTSLLERVRRHDQAAWQQLVRLFGPLVYRWCRSAGFSPEDAADTGQEVFRSVFVSLPTFRRDQPGQSFRSWLRVVARSRIADALKKQRRRPPGGSDNQELLNNTPDFSSEATIADDNDADERTLIYRRALEIVRGRVTEKSWQVFNRVVFDGRPVEIVATELNVSKNSIYLVKSRIMRQLRELLAEFGET